MLEAITNMLPRKMQPYAKLVIGIAGVVLTILAIAMADNGTVAVLVSIATALGVMGVPNKDADHDGIPDYLELDDNGTAVEPEDDTPDMPEPDAGSDDSVDAVS